MFSLIRSIQSANNDELLDSFMEELDNESIYVPRVLIQMVECIKKYSKWFRKFKKWIY